MTDTGNIKSFTWARLGRVLIKTAALFIAANLLFGWMQPLPALGQLSLYNRVVPGRTRLPYGEDPAAYNLSLNSIEAMFASHAISQPKRADEFRVVVLGDSSVWGVLLRPDETLTGQINAAALIVADGRRVQAYNLGYPLLSATKDLLLLDYAMPMQPDLIVWVITLDTLALDAQLAPPLV
ncbi:MAG: hypothetical protein H7Y11_03305, partial [Armatimonadetes bacterium]|nr:hypothetical protein [Anaerolineae bacterium]